MIEVDNLWKSYHTVSVLRGLNLKVESGETLVILGQSGVGKSVLLKLIIGIEKADKGKIKVGEVSISSLKREEKYQHTKNMGMLFQGSALFDSMNIEENTAFFLKQNGNLETGKKFSKSEIRDRVEEALKMVDLDGINKKMPSELSGGMRKRAALARLIVYRPQYLLYDEPTTGLDPITAGYINELIIKTQKELKATSLVVTHDIISALSVSDRLALHKEGKIAYLEKPEIFLEIDDPIINCLKKTITKDPHILRRKKHD